jgi:hypothetical protein
VIVESAQLTAEEKLKEAMRAAAGLLRIDFFRFEWHIGTVIQRAFVYFCRGFEFSLHQSERQAAFLAIDK